MKLLLVLSVCAAFLFLAVCGGGKSPGQVIEAAFLAANEGKYSEANKYLSSTLKEAMDSPLGAISGGT